MTCLLRDTMRLTRVYVISSTCSLRIHRIFAYSILATRQLCVGNVSTTWLPSDLLFCLSSSLCFFVHLQHVYVILSMFIQRNPRSFGPYRVPTICQLCMFYLPKSDMFFSTFYIYFSCFAHMQPIFWTRPRTPLRISFPTSEVPIVAYSTWPSTPRGGISSLCGSGRQ